MQEVSTDRRQPLEKRRLIITEYVQYYDQMHRTVRIKITELNPNLICVLCGGYYIDACTIIECLHSFCRTCITNYLQSSKYCPICDAMVHKTKPLLYVKSDKTLQDLVYKLVPGLYKNEMKRRREYYAQHSSEATPRPSSNTEERGIEDPDRLIYTADEKISLSLELQSDMVPSEAFKADSENNPDCLQKKDVRYLQCPAAVSMFHLKKFLRLKFELPNKYKIDIYHSDEPLKDFFTLMDVAYIYMWRRTAPLRLLYTVYEKASKKRKCAGTAEMARVLKQARMTTDEEEQLSKSAQSQPETVSPEPDVKKTDEPKEKEKKHGSEKEDDDHDDVRDESKKEENNKSVSLENDISSSDENFEKNPKPDENSTPEINGLSHSNDEQTKRNATDSPKSSETKNDKESPVITMQSSPKKSKVCDKSPYKGVLSSKYSPKLHHNGKVFSPTFFKKQRTYLMGSDEPLDMTKKTLKDTKRPNGYSPTKTNFSDSNGVTRSLYPAYEFTD
ncbi:hypothetical protein FSP39_007151 [Pinctada imbricata]|uniref:RING-type domain-containing protein n=1 Tax=Pinctada imbricata TaxID=66713 RepID=A0AA89C0Z5_PINIB|nr:hypothetical protein FSP39_007151 [Pinctada imbricata]